MAVAKAEEFLKLLEKSQVLEGEQLQQARAAIRQGDNAKTLAARLVGAELLTDWQAAQLVAGRTAFFLGKYKLIRPLGRGGVFLADHTAMNRQVALKTISRDVSAPGSLEKFVLEARTIASLDHPNVVQAYSFDNEGSRFFLVMEFVDGQDLEQMVQAQGPLEYDVAADYIRQTANGLQHGHDRKVVHSDVKPSNILVNRQGVVKIVNMGLSRLQEPSQVVGQRGSSDGSDSVDYRAPEQALGTTDLNHRVDVYSLGCTLYFLLVGEPPFPGGASQSAQPKDIGEVRPDVPDELVEICERMMAKKPGDRYQTAAEVSEALAKFPPPKRKAKPAARPAPPLKTAQALPIQADEQSSASMRVAARKSKFLATPRQKIIAGAAAGVALLVLAAILVPFMMRSPGAATAEQDPSWIPAGLTDGGQPAGIGEQPADIDEPAAPPVAAETTPQPPPSNPDSLDYGFGAERNPMGVELGTWYTTGQIPSKNQQEKFFPEDGVDLQAKGPNGNLLWREEPSLFEGIPNMFPSTHNSTTYMFRTITAKKPTTLHAGFGSDDTLDVWLNGEHVLAVDQYRAVDVDTERAYLRLNVGENELLLKIRNGGGEHGFSFDGHLADARETGADETPSGAEAPADGQVAVQTPAAVPSVPANETTPDKIPQSEPAESGPGASEQPAAKPALSIAGNLATFNLDEASGRLFDLSGTNHHGIAEGTVTYNETGKHRGALRFDGGDGRVILKDSADFDFSGSFTWTAWIKTRNDGPILAFSKRGGNWSRGGKVMFVRDAKLAVDVNGTGWFGTRSTVNDDKWRHVALVVKANTDGDRDEATLYVDGKADGGKNDWNVDKNPAEADSVMKIGYCNNNFWKGKFNGLIDDVTIWNRALDATEIAATMEAQVNPFEALAQTGNLEPYGKAAMPPNFHSLGELSLNPDADVDLQLVGGRKALPLPRYFQIERGENGKRWLVCLCAPTRGGEPVKAPVAQMLVQGQKLLFQWAKGVPSAKANALLNCGLDVSVDGRTFFLPLGRPVVVKPVVVNITTGTARSILPGDSLPLRESLRLQVVRVEGFPEPRFSPGDTLAPGEATDISFDPETFPKLWLHLAFDVKMRPTVEVTTKIDYEVENMTFRTFKLSEAEQLMNVHQMERRRLFMEMRKVPITDQNKIKDYANKIKKVETEKMAKLVRLGEICKKLKEKPGKVHFRIYTVIDEDHEFLLMQSFPLEKPGGDAAAPPAKDE